MRGFFILAEREGFEPPVLLQTTVFKTAAFDHSAISPSAKLYKLGDFQKRISQFGNIFFTAMFKLYLYQVN